MDGGNFGRFPKSSLGEKIPVPPRKPLKLDDVPMWTLLPYDTKYPLTEYSKKVIAREEIGKSLYPTFPSKEFDLSQAPVPVVEKTDYDPLHDPHLRQYFHHAWRFRNLVRKGLVTKDGKVKSRLKDYNQYRIYLYHLWALQVNQLNRTQVLEEKNRLENLLKAHESGDSLFKVVTQKYDKIKVEEILDEVTFKMSTDGAVVKKYGWSPLIQCAIQWKIYQEKLKKNFRLSYPAVKQWLCEETRHYKQFIERKLNARRNREKRNRSRWERIYESSLAHLQKELKLQAQEKEKKRALSEQRYNRAKNQWEKNERKINLTSKSSATKSFTDLSLVCGTGLRKRNITNIGSTSSPDVSTVEKYSPVSSKIELQKLYQEESIDFKQTSTTLTKEKNFETKKSKFKKLTINENEVTNNIQPANYTKAGHDTIFDENYRTMDDGTVGKKYESIRSIPKEETKINKIVEGKLKEILDVEESAYLPSQVSKHNIGKKEKLESFETKFPIGKEKQTKTDYRKEFPVLRYFDSNTDQDTSSNFDSFKKDKRTIFDENYQTPEGNTRKISENTETIPQEERKISKKIVDAVDHLQKKSPTGEKKQTKTDYSKELLMQRYSHTNIDQDTSSKFDENYQTDDRTFGQTFECNKSIPEEKKISTEITDGEPNEILDVEEIEYLFTHVSEDKIEEKEELHSFQTKSPTGGNKQMKTDYGKELSTQGYFDSNIDKDTSSNFDSLKKDDNRTTYDENDQTLDNSTVGQKSKSFENIPEEERKIDKEIIISPTVKVSDVKEKKELLSSTSREFQNREREELDSFLLKTPMGEEEQVNTDYKKEISTKENCDLHPTSVEAEIRKETNILDEIDEDPSRHRNYLNGLQDTDDKKGFSEAEYDSEVTPLKNEIELQATNFTEKSKDIHIVEKLIAQKDFESDDTSAAAVPRQSALKEDQLKLRDYLYGLPEFNKKHTTGNETTFGIQKSDIQEKAILKEDTQLIEKVDIPTLSKSSLDCLTERGYKKDSIWKSLGAFFDKKKKKLQKNIGLEKIDLITQKTEILRKNLSIINYKFDTEPSFGKTVRNKSCKLCSHTDMKRDFSDFDEKLKDLETAADRKNVINTIFKNSIKWNKIIPYSYDISTKYLTEWLKKDFKIKGLNSTDELYFQHRITRRNIPGYEKMNEYKMNNDNYSSSDSKKNAIKQIINKHAVQNHLNELAELTYTYKTRAARTLKKNKLENSIYFPEAPKLITETKEYQKSKYLNSEFYKKRKEKLDMEFYDWYRMSKKQSGQEIVKGIKKLHTMCYNFRENESDLQTPVAIQEANSLKDYLNICQIHFNKECKKVYTTSTQFLRDTKLENEALSPVFKKKYDDTGFLSDEKNHKISEQEKYTNTDSQEPVTEGDECKKYIYSIGKSTITDISNDVQKLKTPNAVFGKILDSPKLEMQKDSKSNVTDFEKIIDEIIKEVEIKQINNNTDVSLNDNVRATQPQQSVAHEERLEYEQLDFEKLQRIEDTSNDVIKTTVSENKQSSEREWMQNLKHLKNGMRIIKQYPSEDLSGPLKHELNVNTTANLEETNLRENLIDKRQEETDICLISTNIEKTRYNSTAMARNKGSTKENQNKITESSSIVNIYDKSIDMYLKSIEKAEKTGYITYELADSNHDENLNHEDYSVKSHIPHSASPSYSPEDSVKEKSSFNFKSDISEDLKILQRGLDSDAKVTLEGQDRCHVDISQPHNLSVSQTDEFDDDLMRKKTEIVMKNDEKCKLNGAYLTASVSLTVDNKSAEMKQSEIKTENQKAPDTCEDAPLFELNDQLGFFYNPTKPLISKSCEITRNMKKWAPVNSAGRTISLLQKKSLGKKTEIAKIRDMFFKSDEDFILPSKIRCLDASDTSDIVIDIQPTSMVSFIESRKQDIIEKNLGKVSEHLKSEMNAEKLKNNIEMHTKVDKMTLKPRISDLKYISTSQNEIDNAYCYQIKSDDSYKTKYHQKDEAQIKNYKFFELEEKNADLNSVTDFLFSVHSCNKKSVPDMTDHQLLQSSFENITIKDPGIMQSNVTEKEIKQPLSDMDKCKDKTCSKITKTKKETIYDHKLHDSSHKLPISNKSEIYESTVPQITHENTDLTHTDNFTHILIINETNNKLTIPDFESRNSNDLKCNFGLIQNVSKYKIVKNMECTNGAQISPIHAPYESIKADAISQHRSKRGNTGILIENEDSDNSIKHASQLEIVESNSTRQKETIESFSNNIEDNKGRIQVEYNNNLTPDILLLNRHTDKDISITSHFSFDKSSSSTENLDSISLNIKFSDSPINAKLNSKEFKIFLNNCISEILQKYKISKSSFFADESDSNTDMPPEKFSDCTPDTNSEKDLSNIESFPQKIKKQQTDNATKNTYAISSLPGESCKNLSTNVQRTEYSSKVDERAKDEEKATYFSVNDIFYLSQEGFSNEVTGKDVDTIEVLNTKEESQIPKNPEEKNTDIKIEQPEECYDTPGKESRNYIERKSFMRKIMDPITKRKDSIPHKEKIEITGYQTIDKQHPFKNTDIFITKDIKSFTDDFKDDSNNQTTYFHRSPGKADKFEGSNANSTLQTSSKGEKIFDTNSKFLCKETSNNEKSSGLNKAENLLPIISTARLINMKIMDITEERTRNLNCYLKESQEKSTDTTFIDDDQDKN